MTQATGASAARRWLPVALLVVALVGALGVAWARERGTETRQQRIERISSEVRCPTCQGLSARESDAPAARAVVAFVTELVDEGRSDAQVKGELQRRFGVDILLRPPARGVAGLVWALPVGALVLAVGGLALALSRWRSRSLAVPDDADRVRVERERR